jgi:precorrin-6B methylase 2
MATKSATERSQDSGGGQKEPAVDAAAIVALVPMRPWDVIGDLGSESVQLTVQLARYAYGGKVYAVGPDQKHLDAVMERAAALRVGNVQQVASKETSVPLEDGGLDGVVIAAPGATARSKGVLKEAHRLMRKGGWLAAIISPRTDGRENGSAPKKSAEALLDAATEVGFKKVTSRPLNGHAHLLVLSK